MDTEALKKLVDAFNGIGEKLFHCLIEYQEKLEAKGLSRELLDSLGIDATTDILSSLVANSIGKAKDLSEKEVSKIAKELCARIRDELKEFYLETGATLLRIDVDRDE